jgi:hypothetical protein
VRAGATLQTAMAFEPVVADGSLRIFEILWHRPSLVDDMLGFSAHQSEPGQSIGDDFRDGKVALPALIAFARSDTEERAFWHRTIEEQDQRVGDIEREISLLRPIARSRLCGYCDRRAIDVSPRDRAACANRRRRLATERRF